MASQFLEILREYAICENGSYSYPELTLEYISNGSVGLGFNDKNGEKMIIKSFGMEAQDYELILVPPHVNNNLVFKVDDFNN